MRSLLSMVILAITAIPCYGETGCYSDYLRFTDCDFSYFYYSDGTVFNGPYRSNGSINIVSFTPGRDNDPYFYSLTLAMDFYRTMYPDSTALLPVYDPHPPGTDLWIEPYELMSQGSPWFQLGADSIPFGYDDLNWQYTFNAADAGGLVLANVQSGTRIILEADSLHLRETYDSPVCSFCVSDLDQPVIWIDNQADDDLFIRSVPPDSGFGITVPLTLGCNGDVYIMGDILYEEDSGGMLGVVSTQGDMIIADTPEVEPWTGIWRIETEKEMTCSGSFLMAEGYLVAENYHEPDPWVDFHVFGGTQLKNEWITACNGAGYRIVSEYDERLFSTSPPFYPIFDTGTGVEDHSLNPVIPEPVLKLGSNPFFGSLNLTLTDSQGSGNSLSIFDLSGRRLVSTSMGSSLTLDTGEFPAGTYVILLETPSGDICTVKAVKL